MEFLLLILMLWYYVILGKSLSFSDFFLMGVGSNMYLIGIVNHNKCKM